MFHTVDPKERLPKMEERILEKWDKEHTFKKSLKKNEGNKPFVFYDGPPFATGTPHYGHLVQSIVKDVVPRYHTMRGRFVERRWGWDCHGLPIENIVEKEMGSRSKKDIEKMGIEQFNALCRANVLGYVDEWKKVIRRTGRWADMDDAYRTMDPEFMESVWWVFKELWKKGLVYEDYRSMHICPRCETTLSQSEVAEGYREIKDLSVIVKFELSDATPRMDASTYVLSWTTTPWTLPGNVALAIGEGITYQVVRIQQEKERYIVAKERVQEVMKDTAYEVIGEVLGKDLIGLSYKPLFDFYANGEKLENRENGWKVYSADFVTTEEGTGVVHIAPAFGEDDRRLGKEKNLPFIQHIGMDGVMKEETEVFAGLFVKPKDDHSATDVEIIKHLAREGALFSKEKYTHSYPHCWRCDTPLLNYATGSWFVKVEGVKEKAIGLAKGIHWVPKHIKEGRFGKWLEGARDWSISRQRFWASAIPIWRCEKCSEMRVVGSVMEIAEELGGVSRLYLVRHGEARSNAEKFLDSGGDPKNTLTEKGREQIARVAQELKAQGVDVIITSPLVRARQSAEILSRALGVEIVEDDRLRETGFGKFDGGSIQDFRAAHRSLASQQENPDGVEPYEAVRSRVKAFIDDLNTKYHGKTIAVVAHADSLRTLYGIVKEMKAGEAERMWFPKNAEVRSAFSRAVDLHRPGIDKVVLKCECGGQMRRVSDVLDTWFDSGSMPFAAAHYPFEKSSEFRSRLPADFIAESVDQTRAWFYYLHILASAVKDSPAFRSVIVSGVVLAEDGKKMSKKLKNYPDPMAVLEKYGADTLRMYLLSSPVVSAENLNFSEKELSEISRGMFRMLWNSYSFFVLYANIDNWQAASDKRQAASGRENLLDQWIISELRMLAKNINEAMEAYELARAARLFAPFIDHLSNWYIRRSRKRFWKSEDDGDKAQAYETLHFVLVELAKLLAPFAPFVAEEIYSNLATSGKRQAASKGISVHLADYPHLDENLIDEKLNTEMREVREIVSEGLKQRAKARIKVRQPLGVLRVEGCDLREEMKEILKEELNVKNVVVGGGKEKKITLSTELTPELISEGQAREVIRAIQEMRKKAGYEVNDHITVGHTGGKEIFSVHGEIIAREVLAKEMTEGKMADADFSGEVSVDGEEVKVFLKQ